MPPVRRKNAKGISNSNNRSRSTAVNSDTESLRRQCTERGLPNHGRRTALISRLQQHTTTSSSRPTVDATGSANLPSTSTSPQRENPQSSLFSEDHLAQIRSIVSRSVEESVAVIATNAARAAVEAMSTTPQQGCDNRSPAVLDEIAVDTAVSSNSCPNPTSSVASNSTTNSVPYSNGFHEVPASYVKKIQAGEFFDLSKLLPKNISISNQSEDTIVLTLENSVIKAKKACQPTARITDIEQWTTAFSTYMSVMTYQYPTRAQELLQHMSLIRHAAHTHRGLGWCVYDHKFRSKAALNPSLDWSIIDQQLWLMIFTITPDMVAQQYPIFSNGPHRQASSGGARGGFCHMYNGKAHCNREACIFRHMCNKCYGPHPGCLCPSVPTTTKSDGNKGPDHRRDDSSSRRKKD